ncbi:motility associated factor glycosyltransferase family protein [Campylobacter sp. 2018MI35]|uniref:motility associated factor glycosyltransferase family protein n=1 Tax=Campylobacter sp. 2018MI34 TaxID=2800582 RepID=UPI0019085B68|nr:motility associated factor glycosyltransferase family protein [Campylobacter sp. 2018MI34]MBK1992411.1 motility associated factor glycosyltransferase family protein [Campylobacter sp. 2018MI34]
MNSILEKNIKALASGVNEPLALKLQNYKKSQRFVLNNKFNIYDKNFETFIYDNDFISEELNCSFDNFLAQTKHYPFICFYGIANALLIKNLTPYYKRIFVFESEIELLHLALSILDLSEELSSGKIHLLDITEEKVNIQFLILFDMKGVFEYLNLFELFPINSYYKKFHNETYQQTLNFALANITLLIRNLHYKLDVLFLVYDNILCNIPTMLENIPFQRLIAQRKNAFDTAIVVSAGPSLTKQLPLLKKYQNKVFIFCADGALNILLKEDIKPDYVTNLDYDDLTLKFYKEQDDRILNILAIGTNHNVAKKISNKIIILRDDPFYKNLGLNDFGYIDTGTHVSHFSYTLALALGFKNIIMIGQDLAYDEKGNSHSESFALGIDYESTANIQKIKCLAYGGEGEVLTHIAWNDYRIKLEYLFACNKEVNFYNATEGGARINFTKEVSFKNACETLLHKEKPKFENLKPLTKNRSAKLIAKFFEKLKQDKQTCENLLNDAKALKEALNNILSKDIILPLEFLQNVYQNISTFNEILNNSAFLEDSIGKALIFNRGFNTSKVLKMHLNDEREHLYQLILAYKEFLTFFIQNLKTKYEIIQKYHYQTN